MEVLSVLPNVLESGLKFGQKFGPKTMYSSLLVVVIFNDSPCFVFFFLIRISGSATRHRAGATAVT